MKHIILTLCLFSLSLFAETTDTRKPNQKPQVNCTQTKPIHDPETQQVIDNAQQITNDFFAIANDPHNPAHVTTQVADIAAHLVAVVATLFHKNHIDLDGKNVDEIKKFIAHEYPTLVKEVTAFVLVKNRSMYKDEN